MDTAKDTTMQHVTDVTIEKLRMLAEDLYVNGYTRYSSAMSQAADELERLESDLATAEQDSRQKQARIERLEQALGEITWSNDSKWQSDRAKAALEESK